MKARIATAAAVFALTIALLALLLATFGYAPLPALAALWRGSFGSWYSLTSSTLVRATPLLIAGLAVSVAFRAGVLNIGVEGQLLAGATAAAAFALAAPQLGILLLPLGACAGALGGCAWAAGPAFLKRRFGVLEVISTLMFNAIAGFLVSWLVRGPLQEPTHVYPQTAQIVNAAHWPLVLPGTRLHAGFLLAVALAGLVWWITAQTAVGFQLRAAGANASAAASAGGVDVPALAARAFFVSGALAGLAGAVEIQGVTFALYENISPGYGYTAIAVALLARLDARAVIPSAILFGSLEAGAGAMQRDAGVPAVLVKVVEAVLILCVLALDAWRRRRPTVVMTEVSVPAPAR